MARLSEAELMNIITEAVTAAGGEITHNALVDALQAAGVGQSAYNLPKLVQSGAVAPEVKCQEVGAPVLVYRMPA